MEKSMKAIEDMYEKTLSELPMVPMEEAEPCQKSPAVSNFPQLEEEHAEWVSGCVLSATKVATVEYNKFYQRFANFVDMLTWKAGCGAQHEVPWEMSAKLNGFEKVSSTFDAGYFSGCDWDREEKLDESQKGWRFDDVSARGWTGTSRHNMDEQAAVKSQYPMPSWLRDLRNVRTCMQKTAAGDGADINSGISASVDTVMEDASLDDDRMDESSTADSEYERLLEQMRR
jgi:hypothetical protein